MTESRGKPRRHSYDRYISIEGIGNQAKKDTYTFNRIPFLLCDGNSLGTGRQSCLVIVKVLTQQLQELIRVLTDDLGNLGVPGGDLLQDGLKHVGLLLNKLSKLLEVGVATEEVKVGESVTTPLRSSSTRASTTTATITSLSSGLKKVDGFLAT